MCCNYACQTLNAKINPRNRIQSRRSPPLRRWSADDPFPIGNSFDGDGVGLIGGPDVTFHFGVGKKVGRMSPELEGLLRCKASGTAVDHAGSWCTSEFIISTRSDVGVSNVRLLDIISFVCAVKCFPSDWDDVYTKCFVVFWKDVCFVTEIENLPNGRAEVSWNHAELSTSALEMGTSYISIREVPESFSSPWGLITYDDRPYTAVATSKMRSILVWEPGKRDLVAV